MDIREVCSGGYHKILKVNIAAGEVMQEHYSTSDAFIIVMNGKARLVFQNKQIDLAADSTFMIPGLKLHSLEVLEDLQAYFILGPKGGIEGVRTRPTK